MLDQDGSDDFWCPLDDNGAAPELAVVKVTPIERATLSRLCRGEWIPDAHIERLEARGLLDRARGEVRLTPVARAALEAGNAASP